MKELITIRVLQFMSTITFGGVQSIVLNYSKLLEDHKIVFDYILQGKGDPLLEQKLQENGAKLFFIPEVSKQPFQSIFRLFHFFKQHPEYKILHCHQNFVNIIPLFAAKMAGIKCRISHSHSFRPNATYSTRLIRRALRILIRFSATDYWACSKSSYLWLYGKSYSKSNNSYLMNNAINPQVFMYNESKRKLIREQYKLEGYFTIICVATLSINKNQLFLLEIMRNILKINRNIKLILVGGGEYENVLKQTCNNMKINKSVLFLGSRKDIPDLLSASDCFLLASKTEGFPISVVEAIASGLPCILSSTISSEVKFNERVILKDITEKSIPDWIEAIISFQNSCSFYNRYKGIQTIKESGYDLIIEAGNLASKYKELYNR